nr:proline-rich receptor-like protein kinase PERK3 [Coffea arabica]
MSGSIGTLKTILAKEIDPYACVKTSSDLPVLSTSTSFSGSKHVEDSRYREKQKVLIPTEATAIDDDETSAHGTPECVEETGKPDELFDTMRLDHQQKDLLETSICSVCKNRRPTIGWHRDFHYAELHEATAGFSDDNFLGEGGFGSVYKGELKNGLKIAVKQHKDASLQGEIEFKSEVAVLSKAKHQNLVMLLGSCSEGNHRLLVYEFVCNGSLDQHLSKAAKVPLTWEQRIKIALGAAKGLEYVHSHNIIHRDMRPNNILITHDYESLLGDFGLAKTQHGTNSDDSFVGTLGYMAPEYAQTGKVSTKTDVYSFGVVLLQLISGRRTTDKIPGGKSLIGWAKPLLKERNYPDLIDRRIIDSHDFLQLFRMIRLTEKCLCSDPSKRFTMEEVVNTLTCIKDGHTAFMGDFSPLSKSINAILDPFVAEEYSRNKG